MVNLSLRDIVASEIDSGVNSSVTLRSYTGSPSEPRGNQSIVSPARSSNASRGNKPSESTIPPVGSSSASRGLRKQAIAVKETATQGASKVKKMFSKIFKSGEKKESKPTA